MCKDVTLTANFSYEYLKNANRKSRYTSILYIYPHQSSILKYIVAKNHKFIYFFVLYVHFFHLVKHKFPKFEIIHNYYGYNICPKTSKMTFGKKNHY